LIFLREVEKVERNAMKDYCIELQTKDKTYYISLKSDEDLYSWMDAIYLRSPLGISTPTNFVHNVHVGFDQDSGMFTVICAYAGLAQGMEIVASVVENHTGGDGKESTGCLGCPGVLFREFGFSCYWYLELIKNIMT
jgi:P21-Rho-binding domain